MEKIYNTFDRSRSIFSWSRDYDTDTSMPIKIYSIHIDMKTPASPKIVILLCVSNERSFN